MGKIETVNILLEQDHILMQTRDKYYSAGTTARDLICPRCRRGGKGDFAVTFFPDTIVYYCHHASCGCKGAINQYISTSPESKEIIDSRHAESVKYNLLEWEECEALSPYWERFFEGFLGFCPHDWRYHAGMNRIAMPIFNAEGEPVGVSYRTYEEGVGPKTFTRKFSFDKPLLHFSDNVFENELGPAIVVEDIPSAEKVSFYTKNCGIALMGTTLNLTKALMLAKYFQNAIFWLDKDAMGKAAKLVQEFGPLFHEITMVSTEEDPKDCSPEKIKEVLSGARKYNTKPSR